MIENWETKKEFYFDPPTDCSLLEINQTAVSKVAFFEYFLRQLSLRYGRPPVTSETLFWWRRITSITILQSPAVEETRENIVIGRVGGVVHHSY